MVGLFGAEMAMHFSPEDMGLSAKILGTVFGQSTLECLGNSKMGCRTINWPMGVVYVIDDVE